jgi:hypothetical protein
MEGKGERERGRERKRERERSLLFLKGMTGALAPFSYLVFIQLVQIGSYIQNII